MPVSWLFLPATLAVVLVTTATAARAQTPQAPPQEDPEQGTETAGRPFRGIFGSGVDNREQTLTFTGSVGGAYETDYLTTFVEDGQPSLQSGGLVGIGSATMADPLGRSRASVSASVNAATFYYDRADSQVVHSQSGNATASLQIARNTRLTASQYLTRQPFRLDRLLPGSDLSFGAPPSLPTDSFAGDDAPLDFSANVDLSQQVSESVSITGGYTFQSNQWEASSRRTRQGGRAGVGVGLSRGLSLRLGYGYYQGNHEDDEARVVRQHNIDVGVDYSGAVSLSRRTTLSFNTGSTAIRDRQQTHFRLTGRAELRREIARSWVAAFNYARDAHYVNQLSEIVFSDSVQFSVGGLVNRRVSFHSAVGASFGDVGFSAGADGAHATYATAGLTTALTRLTAIGIDYHYYLHYFGGDVALPEGVPNDVDRQSVRAFITVWTPLMSRERSRYASR